MEPGTLTVVKALLDLLKPRIQHLMQHSSAGVVSLPDVLEDHLAEVAQWSSTVQFFGMPRGEDTDAATIPLRLDVPRRFRPLHKPTAARREDDLLSEPGHCVLLGAPGAGKTTALKRIARQMLTTPPAQRSDRFQYPVVLRLRELRAGETVSEAIANRLGLRGVKRQAVLDLEPASDVKWQLPVTIESARVLTTVLNTSRAVVMFDGLDEVERDRLGEVIQELEKLAHHLRDCKVIITCRSGAYSSHIEGFHLLELCPLEEEDTRNIAERWLAGDAAAFLKALSLLPYKDVADRPLLVTQLMVLFKRSGFLPGRPAEVCRRLVRLLLEEWDAQRRVSRRSKYAGFAPDRKLEFLTAVAYHLTYKVRAKVFSHELLTSVYLNVRESFGLPANEAGQVAAEIESHTGVIAETAAAYEFSHLSLQEYLCAEYLVRAPFADKLIEYTESYPAPVAMAVALSTNPSGWFGGLFLRSKRAVHFTPGSLADFLSRVLIEQPSFDASPVLGICLVWLMHEFGLPNSPSYEPIADLMSSEAGLASVTKALQYYVATSRTAVDCLKLERQYGFINEFGFTTPQLGAIPVSVARLVIGRGGGLACRPAGPNSKTIARSAGDLNRL